MKTNYGEVYCGECKCPCEGQWLDFGHGPYEHFGNRGIDVQWGYYSICCEAEVYKDEICTRLYEPEREDRDT